MSKNLVLARVGEKSLHREWLKNATPNFELVLLFYGKEIPEAWKADQLETHHIPGSKWEGITSYLNSTDKWRDYDRVFMPDDDLLFDAKDLNRFFEISEALKADLSQPALDFDSYYSHTIVIQSKSFTARFTNFVEVMCPCLSRRFLEVTKPLMEESPSGWGMDNFWYKLLDEHSMTPPVIVDEVTVTHTRPVASAGSGCANGHSPLNDLERFCEKHSFKPKMLRTIAGIQNGQLLTIEDHPIDLRMSLIEDQIEKKNLPSAHKIQAIIEILVTQEHAN